MSEIEAQNIRRFYVYSSWIPVIPAGILWNLAKIGGGMESIELSLTSLDAKWTSKSVKALIAPGLCMPIILSLPFLIHNCIITDHTARTCIDKLSNYDLLNPLPVSPPPLRIPRLKEQLAETKADKKLVLSELMLVCNDCLKNHKLCPQITMDFNVAGVICN